MSATTADGSGSATASMLRIQLRPSRLLAGHLFFIHVLAAIALFFTALPVWSRLLIIILLLGNLLQSLRKHYWRDERELICRNGNWKLLDKEGQHDLELAGESYIHPWLTILRFKTCVMPLLPDSADAAQLRELRRTLRFGLESGDFSRR